MRAWLLRGPPTHTATTLRQLRNMVCSATKAPPLSSDLVCLLSVCGVTDTDLRNVTDTLDAYIDKYTHLVSYLADNATTGAKPPSDPAPPDLTLNPKSSRVCCSFPDFVPLTLPSTLFQRPVVLDTPPFGHHFGDVLIDVPARSVFKAGQTVWAQFVGANPRVRDASSSYRHRTILTALKNNLRLEGTFLSVEQLIGGSWHAVRSDSHPSTIYQWSRVVSLSHLNLFCTSISIFVCKLLGISNVNVSW